MLNKQERHIVERAAKDANFTVKFGDYITFSSFTKWGQDIEVEIENTNINELIDALYGKWESFDCSEEAYLWLDNSGHGKNGAPYDMKDIYEDMEDYEEHLKNLCANIARAFDVEVGL